MTNQPSDAECSCDKSPAHSESEHAGLWPRDAGVEAARNAFRAVQLDGGEWCVEFLGHAFVADPEPTQKDAEWLVGELQKDYARAIAAHTEAAVKGKDEEIARLRRVYQEFTDEVCAEVYPEGHRGGKDHDQILARVRDLTARLAHPEIAVSMPTEGQAEAASAAFTTGYDVGRDERDTLKAEWAAQQAALKVTWEAKDAEIVALKAAVEQARVALRSLYECNVWYGNVDDGDIARLREAKKVLDSL